MNSENILKSPAISYDVVCFSSDGQEKWREKVDNLVTSVGKTDLVQKYLTGSAYTASWFLLLAGAGIKDVSDTLATHAGWTELTPYAGNRPTISWGATSNGSNTATAISITITSSATVAGAGICTVNSGTAGILYSIADFVTSRGVTIGDILNITPTISIV